MAYLRAMEKSFRKALEQAKKDTANSFIDIIDGMEEGSVEGSKRATEIRAIFGLKPNNRKRTD